MTADCRSNRTDIYWRDVLPEGKFRLRRLNRWREYLQKRKKGNRGTPIRYVVERVYTGKESMENVLTCVSEEAARKNVEEKLKCTSKR